MNARWRFWLITVGTLLAVGTTLSLGRWQLSRADQKEVLQARIDSRSTLPRLAGSALAALPDPTSELHRGVALRGYWLPQHTVFLDNRQMNAKPGLYVVTPFKLADTGAVVLVQRGWVARNFIDRSKVPSIETPTTLVEIEGRIATPPSKLYELGGTESGIIRQNIDLGQFRTERNLPLLAVSVQQTGAASEGMLREWPMIGTGVDKHYGYAFQWFALSGLIALLYVWFQIVRRFFRAQRA